MNYVVAFSGGIASGKSTLSRVVADSLGWRRASFGGFFRRQAIKVGVNADNPSVLQDLGERLIRNELDRVCHGILQEAGWQPGQPLIIDGLRHLEVAQKLQTLVAPMSLVLVHISVGMNTRISRISQRAGLRPDAGQALLHMLDSHSVEAQVADLIPKNADLVLNGEMSLMHLVQQTINWLEALKGGCLDRYMISA